MARKANYDEKIQVLETKIAKKQEEIKGLRDELKALAAEHDKQRMGELLEAIDEKGLTVNEVIGWVHNYIRN